MYITQSALFFDLVIFISTCTDVLFDLRPGELKEKKGSFERYTWWWWWSSSFFRIWYIWFGVARKYLVRDGRWHDVPPPFFRPSPLPPIRLNNFHVVSINTMCFEYRYICTRRAWMPSFYKFTWCLFFSVVVVDWNFRSRNSVSQSRDDFQLGNLNFVSCLLKWINGSFFNSLWNLLV